MAYTSELLKKEIAKNGGEEAVMAIIFNNAYVQSFREEPLKLSECLNEVDEVLTFKGKDPMQQPFITTKMVEYIEGITFKDPAYDRIDYDPTYIRG